MVQLILLSLIVRNLSFHLDLHRPLLHDYLLYQEAVFSNSGQK